MDFELSSEQKEIQRIARDFSRRVVAPRCRELDDKAEFPWDIAKQMAEMDFFKISIPEEYGGLGWDAITRAVLLEELSKVYAVMANLLGPHSSFAETLAGCGTREQKERLFPSMLDENGLIAGCITEPNAGSDVASISTRAVLDGGRYILNGAKSFVTTGGIARHYCVYASTDPAKGGKGLSAFIVEKGAPGMSFGKPEDKMGMRALPVCDVYLENVSVTAENLLGPENGGFIVAMNGLNAARIDASAIALGISQGALDYAVNYAKQRVQFGRPIVQFQAVQMMLADMEIEIQAARSLLYRAARLYHARDQHPVKFIAKLCASAKCYATDMANRVTSAALQVLGGAGYIKDHPVERMMRDARMWAIGDGTNQIQRLIIARQFLD